MNILNETSGSDWSADAVQQVNATNQNESISRKFDNDYCEYEYKKVSNYCES